ncbi:MAG: ATP-binding protein [Rhodospirillaceae bacterium]|nr:ATP-binding protein [Rhodospirillaceae bacterium]
MRDQISAFSSRAGLTGDLGHQVTLILEELFANLLRHGSDAVEAVHAEIALRREGMSVHIRFSDDGAPFNPLKAPPPGLDGGAKNRAVGGLGVHLVRELTSHAAYRRADGRNILDLQLTVSAERV